MATLYLLHFHSPGWRLRKGVYAQHYLGYTTLPVEERIRRHRSGQGSRMVRYFLKQGNDFDLVYTREFEDRGEAWHEELRLKKTGHIKRLCPRCN